MLFDVKQLFEGVVSEVPVSLHVDTQPLQMPAVHQAQAEGRLTSRAGVVCIDASVIVDVDTQCDRCLAQVKQRFQIPVRHTLVRQLQSEDSLSDEYIEIEGDFVDLQELFRSEIVLELPLKILCRDDCKGLCPTCGCNRNEHECGCMLKQTDPRLDVLKQLLNNEN